MLAAVEKIRKMLSPITIDGRPGLPLTAGVAEAALHGGMDPVDSVTELINRLETALETAGGQPGSSRLLPIPAIKPQATTGYRL